mmetsp:Transcript_8497/g.13031  ORF Transcript_8497/g.13031 Transcript_8497/m.13031 type:complete len:160 (-) Transcript_8497:5963-6442(-)
MLHKLAGQFQAFAIAKFPNSFGSSPINQKEQILHELAVKQAQTMLDPTKEVTSFDPYSYLAQRLQMIDQKKKMYRGIPATKTVFEPAAFQPYHLDDQIPHNHALTYGEYKFLKEKKLKELVRLSEELDAKSGSESENDLCTDSSGQESMTESEHEIDPL